MDTPKKRKTAEQLGVRHNNQKFSILPKMGFIRSYTDWINSSLSIIRPFFDF